MNIQIFFECNDCQHYNKQLLGTHGFERKQTRFESFSEAHTHMIQNPDHYMDLIAISRDGDEEE